MPRTRGAQSGEPENVLVLVRPRALWGDSWVADAIEEGVQRAPGVRCNISGSMVNAWLWDQRRIDATSSCDAQLF
jgi:hypothetical protein